MNFNKLTISDLIDQQLPDFVVNEFPTFVKFFEEYYKSLEVSGGILDIAENFLDYKNIDNLSKFNLVATYKVAQDISTTDTSIVLDKLDGLPSQEGLIKIGNEIILYDSVDLTNKTLLNCRRGFTATSSFSETNTVVEQTVAETHKIDDTVTNLSNLILFTIVKNYEDQYLAGFPYENIQSDIGKDTLIKNIKDFYSYKGTDLSIEFLFRSLFNEEVTIRYPKDYVIKSSFSDWTVDDIIKVESIIGDPYTLVGNEIQQTDASNKITTTAVVDQILVNNISNYSSGNKNIFEIRLNVTNSEFFEIPEETILRGQLGVTDSIVTVDSTIGFPESNGIIKIDDEFITYRFKTFNQFIDCGRGAFSTVPATHNDLSRAVTTEFLFGYTDGAPIEENKVTMRLLGVLSTANIRDGSNYYNEGERVTLTSDGTTDDRKQFTTWIKNESGVLASSSDVQINNNIKNITTDVTSVYEDHTYPYYAYVASTGLPSHPIGDFIGVGFDVRNQNILKTIPLEPEKNTQEQPTGSRPVGLFINGVEAFSSQDYDEVPFGEIERVDVTSKGFGFDTDIQPVFRLLNPTGSNATFNATIVDGKVSSIAVASGGSGFTSDHDLEVTYGFDAAASVVNDTDLFNGAIKTITVTNPGQDYVATPNVEIIDTTGKGKNAYAIAQITNNQLTGIVILNGGVDYTDKSTIRINIISKGTGVVAKAFVKKWSFDRVFLTKNSRNTSGNFVPAQTIKSDTGNGYLFPSRNVKYNLQYGYPSNPKLLRHLVSDNVQGVNANYDEKTSGFVHSPILGWAYDGNPIYGPYGYSNPVNSASGISRQTSSFVLQTTANPNRPSTVEYPFGAFVEDYNFVQGSGSLDKNNGRFCFTPEFPEGRYCYFLTVDNFGQGIYPYILGTTYHSVPSQNNFDNEFDQSRESNLPQTVRRIRSINTPSRGFDATLNIGSVERGSIDEFAINSTGDQFKNLDYLYIDNTDTEGSRAFGRVENVNGPTVSKLSYSVSSGFSAAGFTQTNGIPDLPWPIDISGPQFLDQGLTFDIKVETSTPHLLANEDIINISLDKNAVQSFKTYKVRVSNYQTVNYVKPVINTSLVADVAFNQTTVNVISADDYRENDHILINDEIMKIISIDYNLDQITVDRAQFNTPLRLHAATNNVSLHIPDGEQDYRIAVGDSISSPGVSGVIYSIDKENSTFEVRVVSGSLTQSSVISDSSTPSARNVQIDSVSSTDVYWEIDPTNTGSYYIRDLSFRLVRGTQYTFDVSDGSIFGFSLIFSEDSSNINTLTNVDYLGVPGTPGATIVINKEALINSDVSRVYYYEQNKQIFNSNKFFSVVSTPDGTEKIEVINDTTFKFTSTIQPENLEYLNVVSYQTSSRTAIGKIAKIAVIDGGEGYKKLPEILGVTHTLLDDAKFTYSITGGRFDSVSVIVGGSRYSSSTKLFVPSVNGTGAILTPTIVNGRIISVSVDDPGSAYDDSDTIVAVDQDAEIFAVSTNIGKIKTIRFTNNGSQFNPDYTLSKSFIFDKKVIITDVQNGNYKLAETVTSPSGLNAKITNIQKIGINVLLLDLQIRSGKISVGDILTGAIIQTTSKVYSISEPDIFGNVDGFIRRVGFFDSDLGKLNSSSQKITDSYYYQDFSYVIRSTKGLSDYKKYVDETTHPLGFKLFGEVSVENDVDFEDTVTGAAFSIGLAQDPHANEVIIQLPPVNVESDIVFKKYEISRVNTTDLKAYGGTGGALLNFLDNQIESVQMADISSSLNLADNTYTLTTNDGDFPLGTKNTSVMLALNEVFQEPFQTGEITGIDYAGGVVTITTSVDHNLAVTTSGQTYPDQKYIHISGVTNTGNLDFNDQFEVFDVPSATTIRVLFNNPNGFLTNNDPAICADVQSTIDNLVSILTYQLNNPSGPLPTNNNGIWLDPAESTIVSANRHRDGANLIEANRQEIIDRANAQIAIEYPDFYYPNDPQTTSTSRNKDAYRYIQRNRKEIIDRAAAQIAVEHPDFVYPGDPATASDYRFKDAYRLIQQNRQEIIDNAWTTMQGGSNPADAAVETKCKRDIGLFIDYTSLDLVNGGNEYAREFALQYFDDQGNPLTNGLLGEELASNDAFNAAKDNMILAFTNQLTVTDSTITPDPAGAPLCANVTSAITVLTGIVTAAIAAGSTAGLPIKTIGEDKSGEAKCKRDIGIFIDAVSLDVQTGGSVYSLKFLKKYFNVTGNSLIVNGLSGEILESITAFNKARDLMKSAVTNQLLDKDLTVTPGNAEYWGTAVGTPTDATYNASTGITVVTIANHGLSDGDNVLFKDNSFTWKCEMDGGVSEKTYPRVTDGNFDTSMTVSNVTTDTFEVNVGASPIVNFNVTAADYDPISGDVELTIGTHTLSKYESIKLRDESLVFTCDLDNNLTEHAYPKTTILSETIEDADYDPVNGVLTVTVNNHGWEEGDFIKFDDNSVVFTCDLDGNTTQHSYPRPGSDPYAGKWIPIYDVYEDTFKVQVGISSDTSDHTFISATPNGLKKKKDKVYDTAVPITSVTATTVTINVGSSTDTSTHTFVPGSSLSNAVISGGDYVHTFVSAAENAVVLPVVNSTIANTDPMACADVRSNIDNLSSIVTFYLNQGSLLFPNPLPTVMVGVPSGGEAVCKRDIGHLIDAVIGDMRTGGNSNMRRVAEFYLDGTSLLVDGLAGEVNESITAFTKARDMMKLAITNQLYEKDFTILPDFLTTSGSIDSSELVNAIYTEGQFEFSGSVLKLYEAVKAGTTFHSVFFKFVDSTDDARFSYKLKNILFDGVSDEYELKKLNGSNLITDPDENLLIFIDGILQIYGESYIIDRSVNPNKIKFYKAPQTERHFFGYSFSKYKVLNNFSHLLNGNKKSFELKFGDDNIIPPDVHQILVLLDGVPQVEGKAFTIIDNVLTFSEAPRKDKKCHILYFYGKTFDKTISIWNGNVFENLEYIGQNSPDGCRYQSKVSLTRDIIKPGDLIKIDGETTKEIIRIDERALENTDNLVYTAFVYTDNSYIRGKNAVANAIVAGTPVSGANTVPISGTVGVTGTTGLPTVFDYQVTGVNITNPGLEYEVAPQVIFKTSCSNPGTGARAYSVIENGKVIDVVITNPGSGYTEAPELIFAKKYEIIRPHTPLFMRNDTVIDVSLAPANANNLNVVDQSEIEDILPFVVSLSSISNTTKIEIENKMIRDTSDAGLAYNLQTFDNNKFSYEPLDINDPLATYLGTGVTIEHMNRYAPALTINDFTTHRGVSQGATEPAIINIGPEAYMSYGFTLPNGASTTDTIIEIDGNLTNVPSSGFIELGDELIDAERISGPTTPGIQATVDLTAVGYISTTNISNVGAGYETTPTVTATSPSGTDATITANLTTSGTFKRFDITNGGSNYTYPPIVTLGGGMTGVSATAEITSGVVTGISLDGTTYDTTNSNQIFEFGAGTSIAQNGTGVGEQGGFNIGGSHLRFGDSDGGTREVILEPLDTTGIDTIRVYAIRGDDNNGGEVPEGDSGDESLRIAYQAVASGDPNNANWVDAGIIIWHEGQDGTYGTPSSGLDNYDLSLPAGASAGRVFFKLYQPVNSGTIFDNYGILSVSFLDVNTIYTDSTVTFSNNPLDSTGNGAVADVYINKEVASLSLTDGGTGYNPSIVYSLAFSGGNPTTSAAGISNANYEFDISIVNAGESYDTATVTFTGGGGSNLTAQLTVDENTTRISNAVITNQGSGYTSIPSFQVSAPDDVWNYNHIKAKTRGANGTTASTHATGKYVRLAWRG